MKEIDNGNSNDSNMYEKSFLGWWSRLTEYSLYLFRYNLIYLIFILPSFLCAFIFFIFNAYLFLIAGFLLFIPAGPAILTLYEMADKIAAGNIYPALPRFFSTYKRRWRSGIALAIVLDSIFFITLYPLYFVLVVDTSMKIAIMICTMMTLLLLTILMPHIARCIISGEYKGVLKKSIVSAANNTKASFIAGLLQSIWLFLCILFPCISMVAALLGIPTVIKMSVMYILPQPYE